MAISLEKVLAAQSALFKKAQELVARKGNDYNGLQQESGDTLFNMRVSSLLGITTSPVQGVLVRLSDKFMRLASLTRLGAKRQVTGESIEDTIIDAINYLTYLKLFLEEEAETRTPLTVPSDFMPAPPVAPDDEAAYIPEGATRPASSPEEFLAEVMGYAITGVPHESHRSRNTKQT